MKADHAHLSALMQMPSVSKSLSQREVDLRFWQDGFREKWTCVRTWNLKSIIGRQVIVGSTQLSIGAASALGKARLPSSSDTQAPVVLCRVHFRTRGGVFGFTLLEDWEFKIADQRPEENTPEDLPEKVLDA